MDINIIPTDLDKRSKLTAVAHEVTVFRIEERLMFPSLVGSYASAL
jgi:hypothetical protein